MHLVGLAAVLSTIAIAAPVSSAGAATVTPQTFVTTGPSTFINYNSQTSAGAISSGDQVAA
jgi:spore maturation protein SpmB